MAKQPNETICKNCGHELQCHLKEKGGRCKGSDENDDCTWCIANCSRFWE